MGFSLLTLALAAENGKSIMDTIDEKEEEVIVEVNHDGPEDMHFVLVYSDGSRRRVLWSNGQGYPSGDLETT